MSGFKAIYQIHVFLQATKLTSISNITVPIFSSLYMNTVTLGFSPIPKDWRDLFSQYGLPLVVLTSSTMWSLAGSSGIWGGFSCLSNNGATQDISSRLRLFFASLYLLVPKARLLWNVVLLQFDSIQYVCKYNYNLELLWNKGKVRFSINRFSVFTAKQILLGCLGCECSWQNN